VAQGALSDLACVAPDEILGPGLLWLGGWLVALYLALLLARKCSARRVRWGLRPWTMYELLPDGHDPAGADRGPSQRGRGHHYDKRGADRSWTGLLAIPCLLRSSGPATFALQELVAALVLGLFALCGVVFLFQPRSSRLRVRAAARSRRRCSARDARDVGQVLRLIAFVATTSENDLPSRWLDRVRVLRDATGRGEPAALRFLAGTDRGPWRCSVSWARSCPSRAREPCTWGLRGVRRSLEGSRCSSYVPGFVLGRAGRSCCSTPAATARGMDFVATAASGDEKGVRGRGGLRSAAILDSSPASACRSRGVRSSPVPRFRFPQARVARWALARRVRSSSAWLARGGHGPWREVARRVSRAGPSANDVPRRTIRDTGEAPARAAFGPLVLFLRRQLVRSPTGWSDLAQSAATPRRSRSPAFPLFPSRYILFGARRFLIGRDLRALGRDPLRAPSSWRVCRLVHARDREAWRSGQLSILSWPRSPTTSCATAQSRRGAYVRAVWLYLYFGRPGHRRTRAERTSTLSSRSSRLAGDGACRARGARCTSESATSRRALSQTQGHGALLPNP
jgi:hypothetical protein